jgi:hypothetical protein
LAALVCVSYVLCDGQSRLHRNDGFDDDDDVGVDGGGYDALFKKSIMSFVILLVSLD